IRARPVKRDAWDVRPVWVARGGGTLPLRASAATEDSRKHPTFSGAGAFAFHRDQVGRTVQPGCVRGRFRGAIAAGVVAVPAISSLARRRRRVLLLREFAGGTVVSGRGTPVATLRAGQYDGVHAYPLQRRADPGRTGARAWTGVGVPVDSRRTLADGRADPLVLRNGRGDRGRTACCRELHVRSAQSRFGREPGDGGRVVRCFRVRLAAVDLRNTENRLRPPAAGAVPAPEAAGRIANVMMGV